MVRMTANVGLLILVASTIGCEVSTARVSLADACSRDTGSVVKVVGFLKIPESVSGQDPDNPTSSKNTLLLFEQAKSKGVFVNVSFLASVDPEPNRINRLPVKDRYSDLSVITNNGGIARSDDRIAVIGKVRKDANECSIDAERIEKY